jgi:hypothetical protein
MTTATLVTIAPGDSIAACPCGNTQASNYDYYGPGDHLLHCAACGLSHWLRIPAIPKHSPAQISHTHV